MHILKKLFKIILVEVRWIIQHLQYIELIGSYFTNEEQTVFIGNFWFQTAFKRLNMYQATLTLNNEHVEVCAVLVHYALPSHTSDTFSITEQNISELGGRF